MAKEAQTDANFFESANIELHQTWGLESKNWQESVVISGIVTRHKPILVQASPVVQVAQQLSWNHLGTKMSVTKNQCNHSILR